MTEQNQQKENSRKNIPELVEKIRNLMEETKTGWIHYQKTIEDLKEAFRTTAVPFPVYPNNEQRLDFGNWKELGVSLEDIISKLRELGFEKTSDKNVYRKGEYFAIIGDFWEQLIICYPFKFGYNRYIKHQGRSRWI